MRISSLNSRGFDSRKENLIFDHAKSFDFCFVQEIQIADLGEIARLSTRWLGPSYWSPAIGRQGGVAVLVSNDFGGEILSWRKDSGGRILSLLVKVGDLKINLINIYAPTNLTERKIFFENLHEYFLPADGIIIGGDFNCCERDLDKFGGNFSPAKYLSDFRSAFKFIDVWRKLHPRSREFTWFNSDFSIGSRLDKFFVSQNLAASMISCVISPCCFSDHDFVDLVFSCDDNLARGPGLWKFNNSFLDDSDFCAFVSDRISDLSGCIDSFSSVRDWWDFFKFSLKSEIIDFSKRKRRCLNRERVFLTNRLIVCKQRLVQGDVNIASEIASLESQLKVLMLKELEGSKIRSRVQWLEEGEKPTRYFFKLERERFERNFISSIFDSDGNEVFTRAEMEEAHVQFYTALFSPEVIDEPCKQLLLDGLSTTLSEADRELCEGALSLAELTDSVKSLNFGKSPGPDGFSVEFFSRFWDSLGPLLLRVSRECFANGSLCESMKGSATRLIFKKRGDVKDLKNWRPISLLNVDYKIISKSITSRLSRVLSTIVDADQTCSVPGRSIFSNVTMLRDLLDYIELTDETAILVSLDQEKAFDRVDRSFLMDLLRRFGFGPNFCEWVSTFYDGAYTQVILNGWLTEKVPLHRGVRQGDPLSPLLYVLCVEALACQIRNCHEIRGFLLPGAKGKQAKVRQYADDTTAILKDFRSLCKLFDLISIYEKGSGAKLNKSKTEAMWLGSWKDRTDEPLGLTWVKKMKILGVVFGTVPTEIDNWQPKINKLEKSLNLWKSRSLSLIGKGLIVNVLGLSKLLYLGRVLVMPAWVLARVNQLIWYFIWNSRIETVSRKTCHLPMKAGGINICNLRFKCDALRLASAITTINSPDDSSFFLCKYFLGRRLSTIRDQWSWLRDNSAPSAVSPTCFYGVCLQTLSQVGDACGDLVAKKIYDNLLSRGSSPPLLPYHWMSMLGPGFSLNDHWSLVRDGFTENYKNDLLWLITLRAVKVRDSLKNWGYINSNVCASCPRCETIDHCFLNCLRVKAVWNSFLPALSTVLNCHFVFNVLFVFFSRWPVTDFKRSRICSFLVKSILYGIWVFRNKATFYNGRDDYKAICRYVRDDVRRRIRLDFLRLSDRQFSSRWILSDFCAVENGQLHIKI